MTTTTELANQVKALIAAFAAESGLPEERVAAHLTSDIRSEYAMPGKVWVRADLESSLEADEHDYSPEEVSEILDLATGSRWWRDLSDTTDWEWEAVSYALQDGIDRFEERRAEASA